MAQRPRTKYIFVTGGVVSSLGKGIVAASVGALLETRGLRVTLTKADPYINVDPGTMNPLQHGEVFVTDDGAETDLDIGHYERFTTARLRRENSFSSGQVYDAVLSKERRGDYLGGTVQVVPHITNQIKENIRVSAEGADIAIIEIGGTVGDIEGQPYLESMRQMRYELGPENVLTIHLTLVPYIAAAKELKTKPTQHSVKELRQTGLPPDLICCRADRHIPEDVLKKIANTCDVHPACVFECPDLPSIYNVPELLHKQGLDQIIVEKLGIWTASPDLSSWKNISHTLANPLSTCRIAIIGKYVDVVDSYKSISEALIHAGIANKVKVEVALLDATEIEDAELSSCLKSYDAVLIPGGFGNRGIEGKIRAIEYVRVHKIPFFGICLGMQLAAIEFARNELKLKEASSVEFDESAKHPIIHIMEEQKQVKNLGGTMRLGAYPCEIQVGTRAYSAYASTSVSERHRHRFEFNNVYRTEFEQHGILFSGTSPDNKLVEIMEVSNHPWFVGAQFHPELKSRPTDCHPLFRSFVAAAIKYRQSHER